MTAVIAALLFVWGRMPSWSVRRTRPDPSSELRFLSAVAADLRAGMSIRFALAASAGQLVGPDSLRLARSARSGAPLTEIAAAMQGMRSERRVTGALAVADLTGAKAAAMFSHLAEREAAQLALTRERRALTAQARVSALVVGGLPAALLLLLGGPHRLVALAATGRAGLWLVIAGILMQTAGCLVVWRLARAAG